MIGTRTPDNTEPANPGEYSKHGGMVVLWKVIAPNGVKGFLQDKHVIEHSDGTITFKYNRLTKMTAYIQESAPKCWIGHIINGEWITEYPKN